MSLRKSLIATVLLLAAGVLVFRYLSSLREEPKKQAPPPVLRSVKVQPAAYRPVETALSAYGRVANAAPVLLVAEVGGRLLAGDVPLKEAQRFQAGQVLYRIDDTEARLALQSQKSELLNTLGLLLPDLKADYPEAFPTWKTWFDRLETDKPLPPLPEFRTPAEKNFFSIRRVLTQYYTILSAEERLNRYSYRAPYAGSFAEAAVEVGSIVTPGTRIGRIIRTDRLEAVLPIPLTDLRWVPMGAALRLYNEDRSQSWSGRVVRVSDAVDAATQSVNLYVDITPVAGQPLYEGMYLVADIQGKAVRQAMTLPRNVLVQSERVYVVVDDKLELRMVQVLRLDRDSVLVQGLPQGLPVVVEPLANVSVGTVVKPRFAS